MALLAPMRPIHTEPPRDVIWREVGDVSKIQVFNQFVLLATYIRPPEIALGDSGTTLKLPEQTVAEDRYQAKVGMVIKIGPRAWVDEPELGIRFYEIARGQPGEIKLGDWVAFRPSDNSFSMQIGKHLCRLVPDVFCKMRLETPDEVY